MCLLPSVLLLNVANLLSPPPIFCPQRIVVAGKGAFTCGSSPYFPCGSTSPISISQGYYCAIMRSPALFNSGSPIEKTTTGREVSSDAHKMMLEAAAMGYRTPIITCTFPSACCKVYFHLTFLEDMEKINFLYCPLLPGKMWEG